MEPEDLAVIGHTGDLLVDIYARNLTHIYILPQCSTTAARVLNPAGMDAQFERLRCAISRGILTEDVVAIHSRIIQVSGGIDGLRDRAGLEAAIAAPLQSFGGEDLFPTDIEKIARIGFGLASNHAFIDGNKRIGAMVTQLLLKWNGYQFQLEQNELADMFIGIADGTKDETELRYWINDHIE